MHDTPQLSLFQPSRPPPEKATALLLSPVEREERVLKAHGLALKLSRQLKQPVRLSVTDNRSTMVSFKQRPEGVTVRIHHMFLEAPDPVVQSLAEYVGRKRRSASSALDAYIAAQRPLIRQKARAGEALNPQGRCFDLAPIMGELNEKFFQGGIHARIGWGRSSSKRRRRSIRLGVYDHQTREIRIHPALDRPDVPRFFVEFIVFHEMLHQIFPSAKDGVRHVHHPKAFRDREKAFPHYQAALAWEKAHLRQLLGR